MDKKDSQAQKGCPCQERKDTAVAVSIEDNTYLETLCEKRKDGSKKKTLAWILEQHRAGASA
jgi:hypothetical protein